MVKRFISLWILLAGHTAISPAAAQSARPGWGATPYADASGTGVTFRVWAPNATHLTVFGSFNGWNTNSTPLALESPSSAGIWSADVTAARPGDEYKYSINHAQQRRDPRARAVVHSGTGAPGIIVDPGAYPWTSPERVPPAVEDLVLYEMHIGTFNHPHPTEHEVGTFLQAIGRLDHVAAMGFNAISLMPVAEYAGNNSWGYNPSDPFAVESAYGGPDAFKAFVDACHARNLSVILDVVHNHYGTGDLENSLWNFDGWSGPRGGGIYFYQDADKAQTPWGPRPDYSRPEVRAYIRDNIRMWIEEYRVDGLRWDATLFIRRTTNFQPIAEGDLLLREINQMMAMEFPEKIRIAEDLLGDEIVTTPLPHGLGFHSQWDRSFHVDVTAQITNDAARNLALVADQMTAPGGARRIVYTESHDEVGYLNEDEGARRFPLEIAPADPSGWLARKKSTLGATLAFVSPGLPMIFQGQDMLEDELFSTTLGADWTKTNTHAGIVRLYTDLAGLRRNRGGGTAGLRGEFVAASITNNGTLLLLHRGIDGQPADDVFVVANFSPTPVDGYWIDFPADGEWQAHFNSDQVDYGFDGYGSASVFAWPPDGGSTTNRGNPYVAPWSVLVLSQQPPAPTDSDRDGMPDAWEIARGLDPHDPTDAWLNPDGDAYTNLEEFFAGTDPHAWNRPASAFNDLSIAGTFNDWSTSDAFMAHIADHLWQRDLDLPAGSHQFKFAANDGWDDNWGATDDSIQPVPVTLPAIPGGGNIVLTNRPAGIYRFRFDEARESFTVRRVPVADSDGDNIPDGWEVLHFGSITGAVASANPDGDLYTNLEEYRRGFDPHTWNPPLTDFSGMAVTGDFNGWNLAPNMVQATNAHYTWTLVTNLIRRDGLVFKFVANGAWVDDWGDGTPPHADWPLHSTASHKGPDIPISKGFNGTYRFTFNEQTLEYSVVLEDPDTDGDGIPDWWELEHFGSITGADPNGNPDGDLYDNFEEYIRGTDPHVWNPPLANQSAMAVAGIFNGWNTTPNMELVHHHTWRHVATLTNAVHVAFKFATLNWAQDWGHARTDSLPFHGTAVFRGPDIGISGTVHGAVVFTFNDQTLAYTVEYLHPRLLLDFAPASLDNGQIVIRWNSADGQSFHVRRGSSLLDGTSFTNLATSLPATPPVNVYTDSAPSAPAGFYQIQLAP